MWHTPNDNFHRDVNEESNIGGNNGTFQRITSAKAFGCHWIISSHRMVPSSEMWMLIYNPLELYVYIYITNMNQLSQHIIPLAIDISWYITNKPVVAIVIGLICTNFANDVFPPCCWNPIRFRWNHQRSQCLRQNPTTTYVQYMYMYMYMYI